MTFLPENLSLQEKKACVNHSILTKRTVHNVTTGYGAETGLNRPKNSDKLSVRHDFYPDKRQEERRLRVGAQGARCVLELPLLCIVSHPVVPALLRHFTNAVFPSLGVHISSLQNRINA
jgi:hypothetical protein